MRRKNTFLSARLTEAERTMLERLAEFHDRPMGSVIRLLIRHEYQRVFGTTTTSDPMGEHGNERPSA